ncbi:ABC transporter ATP-binding protein/permease [Nocardia sp. NPDC052566]|uniref:ABC transporter ATP-binding protein/permease n=1 Tax=Nocardia sp. NPDC052566 TaxID=3364330 RepID=UPI0037CAE5DA
MLGLGIGSLRVKTSRDWSIEWYESLKWLLIATSITVVVFVLIMAVLLRTTTWGRQFWRASGGYFWGPGAWRTWLFTLLVIFFAVSGVRVSVLFSYWGNDLFTSLQAGGQALVAKDDAAKDEALEAFRNAMVLWAVLGVIHVIRSMASFYFAYAYDIRWRVWLTDNIAGDWLQDRAFYRGRFIDNTIDNPDQRIQQDITTFVQTARSLAVGGGSTGGGIGAVVAVVSFTKILWDLSGPMTVLGADIPRAMVFIVLMYVLISTVIAIGIGRPLIRLNFLYERATANFRYALVRLRDSAESVAFYRGEEVEHRGIVARFAAVIQVFWRYVRQNTYFQGWNLLVSQLSLVFPYVLQAPRFFSGQVTLGGVNQTASAFNEISDSLSFFRNSYDDFAAWRASLMRLDGLQIASRESRDLPKIAAAELDNAVRLDKVDVRKPDGELLIDDLTLRLSPGDALVVKGPSGSGKTTLLRALAEMWPYTEGEIGRPTGDDTMFLSQIPYLPLGDLRTAAEYPGKPEDISDDALREVLEKVHLGHIVDRLDEEADWAKILSPGEQQRLAFGRILLLKPKVVFLDEATSAVDEGLEYTLYKLIRTELPDTMVISVAHRSTVDQHHTQKLELDGTGPWSLEPIAANA